VQPRRPLETFCIFVFLYLRFVIAMGECYLPLPYLLAGEIVLFFRKKKTSAAVVVILAAGCPDRTPMWNHAQISNSFGGFAKHKVAR
jgi:hypothetical protein